MSRDDKVWEEIGTGISIVVLFLVLLLLVALSSAQEKPVDTTLPPDLIYISRTGCHIDAHHSDPPQYVLNAKTGEEEEAVLWWVVPFVEYKDKRDPWTTKDKDGNEKYIFQIEGTYSHLPKEAVDACDAWRTKVAKERVKEANSMGHSTKK